MIMGTPSRGLGPRVEKIIKAEGFFEPHQMPRRPNHVSKPAKSWCYTLNNPTPEDESRIRLWSVSRQIYGHECVTTPHLQGFAVFTTAKRLSSVKKLLPRAHWEVCKSLDAAWDYCTKGDDVYHVDNRVGSGHRSDWDAFRSSIQSGATSQEIFEAHPSIFVHCQRGVQAAQELYRARRSTQTQCFWLYGPAGCGKSTLVRDSQPSADWIQLTTSGFFFGYHGAKVAVLDDPKLADIGRELFLGLVNFTPFRIPVKGGSVEWNVDLLLIVTNYSPMSFFPCDEAVHRRISKVLKMDMEHQITVEKDLSELSVVEVV
ncbi:MAG: putative viral replication protein [Cressdnaviricota sp.]|nr:MAG: putative viral replication protein [Cressdnaviricota sp.]